MQIWDLNLQYSDCQTSILLLSNGYHLTELMVFLIECPVNTLKTTDRIQNHSSFRAYLAYTVGLRGKQEQVIKTPMCYSHSNGHLDID